MITDDDMKKALDRIARTRDGKLLYLYFQKTLCAVTTSDGALPRNEGRRSFAAQLMSLMAKGIEESSGRANAAITFAVAGAVSVSRTGGGAGRRVALEPGDNGYIPPAEPRN